MSTLGPVPSWLPSTRREKLAALAAIVLAVVVVVVLVASRAGAA
ncbi:hypothetical protein [Nocardioides sp.]|jgi:hypothetical protein|nr:hypothetical protein [Nocardioides sp.]HVX52932.1 hypothetical protein [Nocardioides sp.]